MSLYSISSYWKIYKFYLFTSVDDRARNILHNDNASDTHMNCHCGEYTEISAKWEQERERMRSKKKTDEFDNVIAIKVCTPFNIYLWAFA